MISKKKSFLGICFRFLDQNDIITHVSYCFHFDLCSVANWLKTTVLGHRLIKIYTSSIISGIDFRLKNVCLSDSEAVTLQLWDTAGQERFRSIASSYFRKADGVILLYDVTSPSSFINVRDWMERILVCPGRTLKVSKFFDHCAFSACLSAFS